MPMTCQTCDIDRQARLDTITVKTPARTLKAAIRKLELWAQYAHSESLAALAAKKADLDWTDEILVTLAADLRTLGNRRTA